MTLIKDPAFIMFALHGILLNLGYYIPFMFISSRAIHEQHVPAGQAALLLSIIGAFNTFGRILFGWIADRSWISALFLGMACLLVCTGMTLMIPLFTEFASIAVYAATFGFFLGQSRFYFVRFAGKTVKFLNFRSHGENELKISW